MQWELRAVEAVSFLPGGLCMCSKSALTGRNTQAINLGGTEMTTKWVNRDYGTGEEVAQRAPLPGWIPRPVKRESGRTDPSLTPAHVRLIGVELDDDQQAYVRQKLGIKLGKFATSIERVSVRVTDMNGPRGGVDQVCNVKVVLSGLPSVVVERRHAVLHAAIDDALRAMEQAVRKSVRRRRTKPRRGRRSVTDGGVSRSTVPFSR